MRSASSAARVHTPASSGPSLRARLRGRPLAAVVPIGIGHNNGPPMATRWGLHCWKRAHAEAWAPPGPEVVRLRLRRAAELGLSYRQFAAMLMESGQAPSTLLFTLEALVAPEAAGRLRALARAGILVAGVGCDGRTAARVEALRAAGVRVARWCEAGEPGGLAAAVAGLIAEQGISPRSVLLVGATEADRTLVTRARLAAFLAAGAYFAAPSATPLTAGSAP